MNKYVVSYATKTKEGTLLLEARSIDSLFSEIERSLGGYFVITFIYCEDKKTDLKVIYDKGYEAGLQSKKS